MERTSNEEKSWDKYYYNVCVEVADNSKCLSRGIGAILVRDKCIISTGYNGGPRGSIRCDQRPDIKERFRQEGVCPRKAMGYGSGQGLEYCIAAHAEENSILMCARMGVVAKDAVMYMTCGIPCKNCMIKIINVGVKELVVTKMDLYDEASEYLLANSDVNVRLYDFL
jgi:dCMP deaminase